MRSADELIGIAGHFAEVDDQVAPDEVLDLAWTITDTLSELVSAEIGDNLGQEVREVHGDYPLVEIVDGSLQLVPNYSSNAQFLALGIAKAIRQFSPVTDVPFQESVERNLAEANFETRRATHAYATSDAWDPVPGEAEVITRQRENTGVLAATLFGLGELIYCFIDDAERPSRRPPGDGSDEPSSVIGRIDSFSNEPERLASAVAGMEAILGAAQRLLDDPPASMPHDDELTLDADSRAYSAQMRSPDPDVITLERLTGRIVRMVLRYEAPAPSSDAAALEPNDAENALAGLTERLTESELGLEDEANDVVTLQSLHETLQRLERAVADSATRTDNGLEAFRASVDERFDENDERTARSSRATKIYRTISIAPKVLLWLNSWDIGGKVIAGAMQVVRAIARFKTGF